MSAGPKDAQSDARLTELTIQNLYSAGKQTDVLNDSVVISLAKKHDKTPAQVLLRHLIQKYRGDSQKYHTTTHPAKYSDFRFSFE